MKETLKKNIFSFLDDHYYSNKKILLAFSGGSDSRCLLELILSYKTKKIDLHLAHIDHGWRGQSKNEAKELQKEAEKRNIVFHLLTLEKEKVNGNLEDYCRNRRYDFFQELQKKYNYQAVLLAHHGDDVAETTLKRILEGAHLPYLVGMKSICKYRSLTVWRPLINNSKEEITRFLKEKKHSYIDDYTNRDEKFLRAKMRGTIIPKLSKMFGKDVFDNLKVLSTRSNTLKTYLDAKIKKALDNKKTSSFGAFVKIADLPSTEELEITHLIKEVAKGEDIDLSRNVVDEVLGNIINKKNNSTVVVKNYDIIFDRGFLFFFKKNSFHIIKERLRLAVGSYSFGNWKVVVSKEEESSSKKTITWQDVWMGNFSISLPFSEYYLAYPALGDRLKSNLRLKKHFIENNIPAFLRFSIPVVYEKNDIFYEFLSGKITKIQLPLLRIEFREI
jgi:tRNA(Ile)-lysidine synthase